MPVKHSAADNRKVVILSALIIAFFSFGAWQRLHGGEGNDRAASETASSNTAQLVSDHAASAGMVRLLDKELDSARASEMPPAAPPNAFRASDSSSSASDAGSLAVKPSPPVSSGNSLALLPTLNNAPLSVVPDAILKPQPRLTVTVVLDGVSINDKGEQIADFTLGKTGEPVQETLDRRVGEKIGASKVTAIGEEGVWLEGNHTLWRIGELRSVVWIAPSQPVVVSAHPPATNAASKKTESKKTEIRGAGD